MSQMILENSMGVAGIDFMVGAGTRNAPIGTVYSGFCVLSDTVITAIVPAPTGDAYSGLTWSSGTTIPLQFTSITTTSGNLVLFKGV